MPDNFLICRRERGAAYILTIIVMFVIFSVSAAMLYLADNDILAAASYTKNIEGYEAAVSGVRQTAAFLQDTIDENRAAINEMVLNEILSQPLSDISYESDGQFYFKNPTGGGCYYHKLFAKYAKEFLAQAIDGEHILNLQYKSDVINVSYSVAVKVTEGFNDEYILSSVSTNSATGVRNTLSAALAFTYCDSETFNVKSDAGGISIAAITLSDKNAGQITIKSMKKIGY